MGTAAGIIGPTEGMGGLYIVLCGVVESDEWHDGYKCNSYAPGVLILGSYFGNGSIIYQHSCNN